MSLEVKICGLSTAETVEAAVAGGAAMVGFNFFAGSPRCVTPAQACTLGGGLPQTVLRVAVLVDAEDGELEQILGTAPIDLLQLQGTESPARVAAIKARWQRPVMKVVMVKSANDLKAAVPYLAVADRLLFDAKPPTSLAGALPGGNAVSFDWQVLAGQSWPLPWMLAGGLSAENLAAAAAISGARAVDVSSGVETAPGQKSATKIREFLHRARSL